MPNPPSGADFRNVGILARGDVLRAIETRAAERSLPLGRAAASFIEDTLLGPASPAPVISGSLVNLEEVSTDDLIDELVGRLQQIGTVDAAVARAEAAEAKLMLVASALGGVGTAG